MSIDSMEKETPPEVRRQEQQLKKQNREAQEPHAIETYYTGTLGNILVADTDRGYQLHVSHLDNNEGYQIGGSGVKNHENLAQQRLAVAVSLEDKGKIAEQELDKGGRLDQEARLLNELFNEYKDRLLLVESKTIHDPEIPKQATRHYLVPEEEAAGLQKILIEQFGYDIPKKEQWGFTAEKDDIRLVFIFSEKKDQESKARPDKAELKRKSDEYIKLKQESPARFEELRLELTRLSGGKSDSDTGKLFPGWTQEDFKNLLRLLAIKEQ